MKQKTLLLGTIIYFFTCHYSTAVHSQTFDDFRVNENIGRCRKDTPDVDADSAGNFIVVWDDGRRGFNDVYAQIFDTTGMPNGPNFRVNEDITALTHRHPRVDMAPNGRFIVVWEDGRGWPADIYARLFDSDGTPLISDFKVNDTGGYIDQERPCAAFDSTGGFIVVWADDRNGDWDIYAQRYDSNGDEVGVNFRVDDDPGTAKQQKPALVVNASDHFTVFWQDDRNGNWDVYGQLFDDSGTPVGTNYRVNDDAGSDAQEYPSASNDIYGRTVVAWNDRRGSGTHIYAQQFDIDGIPQGSNFHVNDVVDYASDQYPDVSFDKTGTFAIVWQAHRSLNEKILCQRYDHSGSRVGGNFQISQDPSGSDRWEPAVGMDFQGRFAVAWLDMRDTYLDVYCQRIDNDGSLTGANFRVNDDEGSMSQRFPAVAANLDTEAVVIWADERLDQWNPFGNVIGLSGVYPDGDQQISDDVDVDSWQKPAMAINTEGIIVATWLDRRDSPSDIYAQIFNADRDPVGSNFKVNDNASSCTSEFPEVDIDNDGNFVIVWSSTRNGDYDIYGQRYDAAGIKQGTNFRVDDDVLSKSQRYPSIAMDSGGNFVVVFTDNRDSEYDIYAQRFSDDGSPIGSNFCPNDNNDVRQEDPDVAMDRSGNFVVVWEENQQYANARDVLAQRYDSMGNPVGVNFQVNDGVGDWQWNPAVAMDQDGRFAVVWADDRNEATDNMDIYSQKYDASGSPVGPNVRVNTDTGPSDQEVPDVAMAAGTIYIVWEDYRDEGKGQSIYARLRYFNEPPEAPALLLPADEAYLVVNLPALVFSVPNDEEGDSLHFKVEVATDSSFSTPIPDSPFESRLLHTGFTPEPPLTSATESCIYTLQTSLSDGQYWWRVSAWDGNMTSQPSDARTFSVNTTHVKDITGNSPGTYRLFPAYPNPFNPTTRVLITVPEACRVCMTIFSSTGRVIRTLINGNLQAGQHECIWDGRNDDGIPVAGGVYFILMKTESYTGMGKLLLLK